MSMFLQILALQTVPLIQYSYKNSLSKHGLSLAFVGSNAQSTNIYLLNPKKDIMQVLCFSHKLTISLSGQQSFLVIYYN